MLELEEALGRILQHIPTPVSETVSLSEAADRVLSRDVASEVDLPPFDNSAMDGYAVRAQDVVAAKSDAPVTLRLAGKVPAGEVFASEMASGSCVRIFTGSPLPRGADAVVMQEDTQVQVDSSQVMILETVRPWENVRLRGEDIRMGATVGRVGERISATRLALLAASGAGSVEVGRRPDVGLVATGTELREPGQTLQRGQIYESNRLALAQLVRQTGAIPKLFRSVKDDFQATRQVLDEALQQCDLVVTCGGVSVGEMDFVKDAFQACGGEVALWRVAVKPGRPFAFGRRDKKLLFGLPGNPVSAFVTFLLLVRPALLRWQGAADILPITRPGCLAEPLVNHGPRRHFMRVRVDAKGEVRSAGAQASHMLSSLAIADGLVDVPANGTLPAGAQVKVVHWE